MPCTMLRGPSAVPGRSVVSANNLDQKVKGHGKLEQRHSSFGRVFNTWHVWGGFHPQMAALEVGW